jgi:hypothetical protein
MIHCHSSRIVVLSGTALLATACTVWSAKDPRLVSGSVPVEYQPWPDATTTQEIMRQQLLEHVSGTFPDLTLVDKGNQVIRLSSFRGQRLAVLSAINACPYPMARGAQPDPRVHPSVRPVTPLGLAGDPSTQTTPDRAR